MSAKHTVAATVSIAVMLLFGGRTQASIITEDFQTGGEPGLPGFDPVFTHRIAPDEFGRNSGTYSSFQTSRFTSPGHSLFLAPATDYITFNLAPGEYVDYAEVWMVSFQDNPPAYFHVIGTDGELLLQAGSGPFVKLDPSSANRRRITEIRLTGFEGFFDDLRINVVPEPSTFTFLVGGTLLLLGPRGGTVVRNPVHTDAQSGCSRQSRRSEI